MGLLGRFVDSVRKAFGIKASEARMPEGNKVAAPFAGAVKAIRQNVHGRRAARMSRRGMRWGSMAPNGQWLSPFDIRMLRIKGMSPVSIVQQHGSQAARVWASGARWFRSPPPCRGSLHAAMG
jgi:hypothetical protein